MQEAYVALLQNKVNIPELANLSMNITILKLYQRHTV